MRRAAMASALVVVVVCLAAGVSAQDKMQKEMAPAKYTVAVPEWQKVIALVGQWEATIQIEGKPVTSRVEARMTGDGSALTYLMDRDTPHEMLTVIHPDGKRLMATHYCAAHNQPRLAMVKAANANQVAFAFIDGTNIEPGGGHMSKLTITIVDANHHDATWTYWDKGKDGPSETFHYARKK